MFSPEIPAEPDCGEVSPAQLPDHVIAPVEEITNLDDICLLFYLLFILCLDMRSQQSQTVEKCPQLSFDDIWLLFSYYLFYVLT
jgi:hypothetical protein